MTIVPQEEEGITPAEQTIIDRLNGQAWFTPHHECLVCGCRLSRFCFGARVCARCEPGALWSDATLRLLASLDGIGQDR